MSNAAKNFGILIISLSVLRNYFNDATRFFFKFVVKFVNISKSFFSCKFIL